MQLRSMDHTLHLQYKSKDFLSCSLPPDSSCNDLISTLWQWILIRQSLWFPRMPPQLKSVNAKHTRRWFLHQRRGKALIPCLGIKQDNLRLFNPIWHYSLAVFDQRQTCESCENTWDWFDLIFGDFFFFYLTGKLLISTILIQIYI